jgi:hypothetical protein
VSRKREVAAEKLPAAIRGSNRLYKACRKRSPKNSICINGSTTAASTARVNIDALTPARLFDRELVLFRRPATQR